MCHCDHYKGKPSGSFPVGTISLDILSPFWLSSGKDGCPLILSILLLPLRASQSWSTHDWLVLCVYLGGPPSGWLFVVCVYLGDPPKWLTLCGLCVLGDPMSSILLFVCILGVLPHCFGAPSWRFGAFVLEHWFRCFPSHCGFHGHWSADAIM